MPRSETRSRVLLLLLALPAVLPACAEDPRPVAAVPIGLDLDRDLASSLRVIRLDSWDDPGRLIASGRRVDLLIGWPVPTLAELDRQGLLDRDAEALPLPWPSADSKHPTSFPSDDPRIDPIARSRVARLLSIGNGRAGLATLLEGRDGDEPPPALGSAIVAGSSNPDSRGILDALLDRSGPGPLAFPNLDPAILLLQAELAGALAVDSATELHRARLAIEDSPDPESARLALIEPPPWPPDSVRGLRDDPDRSSLIETLASALVEDPDTRAWLLDSWESPPRPIDRALLAELATAADGRLIDSPRFLPWLRAEWSAWSRQRFDRLSRERSPEEPR